MKFAHSVLILALLTTISACKGKDDAAASGGGGTDKGKSPSTNCARNEPAASDNTTGGCRIRLVTPGPCEEIDLTNGKTYEFAWTTDGTTCETPYNAYIGGNPITRDEQGNVQNVGKWQIPASDGLVGQHGGIARLKAADLEGLTSTDGTFEWVIESFHGSHPASQVFRVKR